MIRYNLSICMWLAAISLAYCQDTIPERKSISYNSFFSLGRSTFQTSIPAPSKFPTLEVRAGLGAVKKLNKTFELRSRLIFGVKLKREAFNKPGAGYYVGPPFLGLDELASNRDHYFYEVPLLVQANLQHPQIGFRAGINYRHFFPNNKSVDALTARGEFGIIGGGYFRIDDRFNVGVDYYVGLSNIMVVGGIVDSYNFSYKVKNHFAQITFEYAFSKKSR